MIWKDNIMKYDYKASAVNRRQKKKTDVSPFFLAFYGFFVFNSHPLPLPDLSLSALLNRRHLNVHKVLLVKNRTLVNLRARLDG